ncbi:pleckstrin homology domain-containing family M member 1 [Paramisgurnus dabryanus]|uniref:pleckstrin homology domain-containing family M member 1 n=1 Tax=Paramisgurnus dabryanus TaxID=90735 RepID=UPI0031F3FE3B
MLATQTTDNNPETKDIKQWIKEKIAQTLKILQKRYITTETVVTSEDLEANLLCCALEAVFIHGIKSKFIRLDGGGHGRKAGSRGALPQPVFWSLLKTVTHRDVVQELERLSFINTDIGRCRAWVRLALNDGLLECYLTSLLREGSNLGSHYQPGALLLDPEDREVLLTLLQGLSSLTFQLSYKSAVLNEWTNTPLVLAGLCPPTPADEHQLCTKRKESWDTVSQSSGGSGGSDWAQEVLHNEPRKEQNEGCYASTPPMSWNQSLDTSGSSQLSTSFSSDSLLQGQDPKSPEKERWIIDADINRNAERKNSLTKENSSSSQHMIQEGFDEFLPAPHDLSITATHGTTDTNMHTSDSEDTHQTLACFTEASELSEEKSEQRLQATVKEISTVSETLVKTTRLKIRNTVNETSERGIKSKNTNSFMPSGVCNLNKTAEKTSYLNCTTSETSDLKELHSSTSENSALKELHPSTSETSDLKELHPSTSETSDLKEIHPSTSETSDLKELHPSTSETSNLEEVHPPTSETSDLKEVHAPTSETSDLREVCALSSETSSGHCPNEHARNAMLKHSTSVVSRRTSTDSLYSSCKDTSWISEDDIIKPEKNENSEENTSVNTMQINAQMLATPIPDSLQLPPSVVHRRPNGLSNPFRGLLKMGQLERRRAVGMWWDYYCELSPFELRLYVNAEERICYENMSLLRCEDVHLSSGSEGCFRLSFHGKRLYLRAPSRGEAEDWVDRIVEAITKLRPLVKDEVWEVLQPSSSDSPSSPSPSSLEHAVPELPDFLHLDWSRHTDPEPDAIKEAVVYQSMEKKGWRSLVLSLSLEALRAYRVQENIKMPIFSHSIGTIRDVVPDVSLGSPAFFKVLTARETLIMRAESGEEARGWRSLIRGALDSYLETEDDEGLEDVSSPSGGHGGSVHRLVQHRLKGDGALLSYLSVVPKERGLDAQNFKCAGCSRQMSVSHGRPRLCEFSAQYYCESCHHGDMSIIPSRMLHNWDLTTREVSREALRFMAQIEAEPLLNINALNPKLFDHSDVMSRVHKLRQQLRFIGDYILICRSEVNKQIQPRLQQRFYLLESSDVFSVLDLQQIADGHYESYLQSLVQLGSKHVLHCHVCTQRGFICQICNADDIIFPFQYDSTCRCGMCKTVFHSSCKAQCPVCPRCVRIQKYMERDLED